MMVNYSVDTMRFMELNCDEGGIKCWWLNVGDFEDTRNMNPNATLRATWGEFWTLVFIIIFDLFKLMNAILYWSIWPKPLI